LHCCDAGAFGGTVRLRECEADGVPARRLALLAWLVPIAELLAPPPPEPVFVLFSAAVVTVWRSPGTASVIARTVSSAPAAASAGRSHECGELARACPRRPAHSRLCRVDCPFAMRTSSLAGTRIETIRTLGMWVAWA
jgi:hypothetical protein